MKYDVIVRETDLDIGDDFHGAEGPVLLLRRQDGAWAALQAAFYWACVAAGDPEDPDRNGSDSTGAESPGDKTGEHLDTH